MFRSQVSFDSTLPKFRLQCTVLLVEFLTWPLEKLQLPVTPLIWYRVWNILMSWVRNTRRLGSWRLLQAGGMQLCMSSIVVNQKGQFWMTFRSSSYATMGSGHRQSRPCKVGLVSSLNGFSLCLGLRAPLWSEMWCWVGLLILILKGAPKKDPFQVDGEALRTKLRSPESKCQTNGVNRAAATGQTSMRSSCILTCSLGCMRSWHQRAPVAHLRGLLVCKEV